MVERFATSAMGTRFEFALCGDSDGRLRAVGEAAIEEILLWHRLLSPHAPDSMVSHIHRAGSAAPVRVDADVWELLTLCDDVWRASDGAFDPTFGSVGGNGWGEGITLGPVARTIRLSHDGVRLEFGAIAKGFALERAADIVREHGVTAALLHGGTSSVIAIGAPPGEDGWPIGVRSAGEPRVVRLRDRAMSVSAPRGRIVDGRAHIIDPRTGASAQHVDTVVVIGPDAAVAEAWSTALVVLGERCAAVPSGYETMIHSERGWMCDAGVAGASFREVA